MAHAAPSPSTRDRSMSYPREATVYAIKELARRAGVSADFLRTWRIEFEDADFVSVLVNPGTNKRLRFPQARSEYFARLRAGEFQTSIARWIDSPPRQFAELVPDFRIPFSSSG